ncbi:MAG: class I SAM-dependent methyltransferase [Mariniphaga sp.]
MKKWHLINTNRWNKIRYTAYAPGYDILGTIFSKSRDKSIRALDIQKGDNVLIVGVGTGLDLEFITEDCRITATDITTAMIARTLKKNHIYNRHLSALVMDGQKLSFQDNSFDKIILHLILAVIPDPIACLKECERVLKPGGRIAIFDKFVPSGNTVSLLRKLLNPLTNLLFSNITRSAETIFGNSNLLTVFDLKADFNGNFRIIQLRKK